MNNLPQLPDTEFTIMQIIWGQPVPISKNQVAKLAEPLRGWAAQTVYTLLNRLVDKGFLYTVKQGKERFYTPLVSQDAYLNQETGWFLRTFHKNSLTGLMNALFSKKATKQDLTEIETWLKENTDEKL